MSDRLSLRGNPDDGRWEVRNNGHTNEYRIERGGGLHLETAAVCWDYDLAEELETLLNNGQWQITTREDGASHA